MGLHRDMLDVWVAKEDGPLESVCSGRLRALVISRRSSSSRSCRPVGGLREGPLHLPVV